MKYSDYYINQVNKTLQFGAGKVFKGGFYQRGYGLGNIFNSLKKGVSWLLPILKTHALPALKSGAETLGRQLVKTASDKVNDNLDGIPMEDSFKNRSVEGINTLKNKVIHHLSGSGKKRKKFKKDIFSN